MGVEKAKRDEGKEALLFKELLPILFFFFLLIDALFMVCFSTGKAFVKKSFIATTSCSCACKRPKSSLASGKPLLVLSCDRRDSYGSLVLKAVSLLGTAARFEASKLKVVFMGEEIENQPLCTIPRAYTLTHCDFTANLNLAVSNNITNDKLREWQTILQRDDVVAEWKRVKDEMSLHVHCYISGVIPIQEPIPIQELAAEFRYHVCSKELLLVLKAVVYGDSALFSEHPELTESGGYGCISIQNQRNTTKLNVGVLLKMHAREHSIINQTATILQFLKELGNGQVLERSNMLSLHSSSDI